MIKAQLKQIRERAEKATPGPWAIDPKFRISMDGGRHAFLEVYSRIRAIWVAKVQTFSDDKGEYAANAELTATARTDIPALCDALEKAMGVIPLEHLRSCCFGAVTGDEGDYCNCGLAKRRQLLREWNGE